jgi:hypothetical protein
MKYLLVNIRRCSNTQISCDRCEVIGWICRNISAESWIIWPCFNPIWILLACFQCMQLMFFFANNSRVIFDWKIGIWEFCNPLKNCLAQNDFITKSYHANITCYIGRFCDADLSTPISTYVCYYSLYVYQRISRPRR